MKIIQEAPKITERYSTLLC